MGTVHIKYKTTSLPGAKRIGISSVLSTSHQCALAIDSVTNEWDASLSSITTVLLGYRHSLSQQELLYSGD